MTRKVWSILGSTFFLVIAPGSVAGLAPWWITGWRMLPPFFASPVFPTRHLVVTGLYRYVRNPIKACPKMRLTTP